MMRNHYSVDTFKEVMKEDPLDAEMLLDFLKTQVTAVHFSGHLPCIGYIKHARGEENCFEIYIDNHYFNDEKEITFIHEIIHGFYHVSGKVQGIEDLIEETSKNFYRENKVFVDNLVIRLERKENLKTILLQAMK